MPRSTTASVASSFDVSDTSLRGLIPSVRTCFQPHFSVVQFSRGDTGIYTKPYGLHKNRGRQGQGKMGGILILLGKNKSGEKRERSRMSQHY
jgi:hypothetical protein